MAHRKTTLQAQRLEPRQMLSGAGLEPVAPQWIDVPTQKVVAGDPLRVAMDAVYPAGDAGALTFSLAGMGTPQEVQLTPDTLVPGRVLVQWTVPADLRPQFKTIDVEVRDPAHPALFDRTRIRVRVVASQNDAPVVETPPPQTLAAGKSWAWDLVASDPDGAAWQLQYELGPTAPPTMQINRATGRIHYTAQESDVGTHAVQVFVADRGAVSRTTEVTWFLEVVASNTRPSITGPGTLAATEDTPLALDRASGWAIEVADDDYGRDGLVDPSAANAPLSLTLLANQGSILLPWVADDLTWVVGQADIPSARVSLEGSPAALNAALAGLVFVPAANFSGTADLRIEVNDRGHGGSYASERATHTVTLEVAAVDEPPVVANQSLLLPAWLTYPTGTPLTLGRLVAEDPDPHRRLTWRIVAGNPDGRFRLDADTAGLEVLVGSASDGPPVPPGAARLLTVEASYAVGDPHTRQVQVLVQAPPEQNGSPVAYDDDYRLPEDAVLTGNVLTDVGWLGVSDTDPDGDLLHVAQVFDARGTALELGTAATLPSGAELTIHADGSFRYDAGASAGWDTLYNPFAPGNDSLHYVVSDTHGATSEATAWFTIEPVNDLHVVPLQRWVVSPAATANEVVGQVLAVHPEPQEALTFALDSASTSTGWFYLAPGGELRVQPGANLVADTLYDLTVEVTDSLGRIVRQDLAITATDRLPPPLSEITYQTPADTPLRGNLLSDFRESATPLDDSDEILHITAINGLPVDPGVPRQLDSGAWAQFAEDGSFSYDPLGGVRFEELAGGATLADVLVVAYADPRGAERTFPLTIEVVGRDDPPRAPNQQLELHAGTSRDVNLLRGILRRDAPRDPDGAPLTVIEFAGQPVGQSTPLTLPSGATATIDAAGKLRYDATAIDGSGWQEPRYETLRMVVSDGTHTRAAWLLVTLHPAPPAPQALLEVAWLGVADAAGDGTLLAAGQRAAVLPVFRGEITGDALAEADHVTIEFDLDASSGDPSEAFDPLPSADPRDILTRTVPAGGALEFTFDPRDPRGDGSGLASGVLGSPVGNKKIAYRVVARDAQGLPLRHVLAAVDDDGLSHTPPPLVEAPVQTSWSYFEFELRHAADAGPLRLEALALAREATGIDVAGDLLAGNDGLPALDPSAGELGDLQPFVHTHDPTLSGKLAGDFAASHARLEFTHRYLLGNLPQEVTGSLVVTEPGQFSYDPRAIDPQLIDPASALQLTIDVRVVAIDPAAIEADAVVQTLPDALAFSLAAPLHSAATVSIIELPDDQPAGYYGPTRVLQLSLDANFTTRADAGTFYIELQTGPAGSAFDDQTPTFDFVPVPVDPNDPESQGGPQTLTYTLAAMAGSQTRLRGRALEWDSVAGQFRIGNWFGPVSLSAKAAPRLAELTVEKVTRDGRPYPQIVGRLFGSGDPDLPATGGAPFDLDGVDDVLVELFFSTDISAPAAGAIPDLTLTTDAYGHFRHTLVRRPAGLFSNGTGAIYARTRVLPPGASEPLLGEFRQGYLGSTQFGEMIVLPRVLGAGLQLVDEEHAEPPAAANNHRWVTSLPRIHGLVERRTPDDLDPAAVLVEYQWNTGAGFSTDQRGFAQPDERGEFEFDVPVDPGGGPIDVTVRARTFYHDTYLDQPLGDSLWDDLYLRVIREINLPAEIDSLTLAEPQVSDDPIPGTTTPVLTGSVVNPDGFVGHLDVEVREVGTQVLLGATLTDASGEFVLPLDGLTLGTWSVEARVADWDYAQAAYVWGAWGTGSGAMTFRLVEATAGEGTTPLPPLLPGTTPAQEAELQAARDAAEANAEAWLTTARGDYLAALAQLPPADQETYDVGTWVWPSAGEVDRLSVPAESSQPLAPRLPNTERGPVLDVDRDALYRLDRHTAEQARLETTASAQDAYWEAIDDPQGPFAAYRAAANTAQQSYQQRLQAAQAAYDSARQAAAGASVDENLLASLRDRISDAWQSYRAQYRAAWDQYHEVYDSAAAARNAALMATSEDERQAKDGALDDAYDQNCEHPDEGSQVEGSGFWCSGPQEDQQSGYQYELGDLLDRSAFDSPPENLQYAKAVYEIDREYAPRYESILNDFAETTLDARREREVAIATAFREALGEVYTAQHAISQHTRDFRAAQRIGYLEDQHTLTTAVAVAHRELAVDLSAAAAERDRTIADRAWDRDVAIAAAESQYDVALAAARHASVVRWHAQRATASSALEVDLSYHQWQRDAALAAEVLVEQTALAEAVRTQAQAVAAAIDARELARATAHHDQSVQLAAQNRDLLLGLAAAQTQRDQQLADAVLQRREGHADAVLDYLVQLAEGRAEIDLAFAEAAHAYGTATPGGSSAGFHNPAYYGFYLTPGSNPYDQSYAFTGFAGGEGPYDGWAYDVVVGWWFGEQQEEVDNESTRDALHRDWEEASAALHRDRSLLAVDAAAALSTARIDTVTAYRHATAQAHHGEDSATVSHYAAYDMGVANLQHTYDLNVVTASSTATVAVAVAEAQRNYDERIARSQLDLQQAALDLTWSQADAAAQHDARVAGVTAYRDAVAAWAAPGTPWHDFQWALALANTQHLTTGAAVDRAESQQHAAAQYAWHAARIGAEIDYADALFAGASSALASRANTVASAEVQVVAAQPVVRYVSDRANAVESHDLASLSATLAFLQQEADADATRDRAIVSAVAEYGTRAAEARYDLERPGGIEADEYSERLAKAHLESVRSTSEANEARANELAGVRRTYTTGIADSGVDLVERLVQAESQWADIAAAQAITRAAAIATAQQAFAVEQAAADRTRSTAAALATRDLDQAGALAERDHTQGLAAASRDLAIDRSVARASYLDRLHAAHVAAVQGEAGANSYAARVVTADQTLNQAEQMAEVEFHTQVVTASQSRAASVAAATWSAAVAAASDQYEASLALAHADQTLQVARADAAAQWYLARQTAGAERLGATTAAPGRYDIERAQVSARQHGIVAEASVAWVATVAAARRIREVTSAELQWQADQGSLTPQELWERSAQAEATYLAKRAAADKRLAEAIAQAGRLTAADQDEQTFDRAQAYSQAERQYATDVALAQQQMLLDDSVATQAHDRQASQVQATLSGQLAQHEASRASQAATALRDELIAHRQSDVALVQARAAPRATHAEQLAQAEADQVLALANAAASAATLDSYADPTNQALRFEAARAQAEAIWVAALANPDPVTGISAIATHRGAVQQARNGAEIAAAVARQTADTATAAADWTHATARAGADALRQIRLAAVLAAEQGAEADAAHGLRAAIVAADAAHAIDATNLAVQHALDRVAIDRLLTGSELLEAKREAQYAHDTALAALDYQWQSTISTAEARHALALAGTALAATRARAGWEQQFATTEAALVENRARDHGRTTVDQWIDEQDADRLHAADRRAADNELVTAQYAARVTAMQLLAEMLDIPWAHYEAARAAYEQLAWQTYLPQHTATQSGIDAAEASFAQQVAVEEVATSDTHAALARSYAAQLASLTSAHVVAAAQIEQQHAAAIADLQRSTRTQWADAEYRQQRAIARAARDGEVADTASYDARRDRIEEHWQSEHERLDADRRAQLAIGGEAFVAEVGGEFVTLATAGAARQHALQVALETLRYQGPVSSSLMTTRASLKYNDRLALADSLAVALTQLATADPSPWADLAAAQAVARRDLIVTPLAQLEQLQQVGDPAGSYAGEVIAAQRQAARIAASAAARDAAVAAATFEAQAQNLVAAQAVANALAWTTPEAIALSEALTPPSQASITLPSGVTNFQRLASPVPDDEYYRALVDQWLSHDGTAGRYYWASTGAEWFQDVAWESAAGAPGSPAASLRWYGGWDYLPGTYGLDGWSPAYTGVFAAGLDQASWPLTTGSTRVDVAVEAHRGVVASIGQAARSTVEALLPSEVRAIATILADTGRLVLGVAGLAAEYGDDGLAQYGELRHRIARNIDLTGAGGWTGKRVRELLEGLDRPAVEFVARHVRLRLTDDGSAIPTYRVFEASRRGAIYDDSDPARIFAEILRNERSFLIEVALPARLNDLQAVEYLLSLLVGRAAAGEGLTPADIARLYERSLITQLHPASAKEHTRARFELAASQASDTARFYYETLGGLTLLGTVGLSIYRFETAGALAGALELVFETPVGKLADRAFDVVRVWKAGVKRLDVPEELLKRFQSGQAVGGDQFLRSLRLARAANDDLAARAAYQRFRNLNEPLVVKRPKATSLLRESMQDARQLGLTPELADFPAGARPQAHHIIPVQLFRDPAIGGKLHRLGIDLNGPENGVWLPSVDFPGREAALHRSNHAGGIRGTDGVVGESYVRTVERRLETARNRDDVIRVLDTIRRDLLNSTESGLKLFNE
jgi:hypothetical protein